MHKLPSASAVRRFRLASFFLCAKCLLVPLSLMFLLGAFIIQDRELILLGLVAVLLSALFAFLQWLVSARTHCPLCLTPVLAKKNCAKHKKARTFLGSHRLRVAMGVLILGRFRCPYCNEPAKIEVRQRNRG